MTSYKLCIWHDYLMSTGLDFQFAILNEMSSFTFFLWKIVQVFFVA